MRSHDPLDDERRYGPGRPADIHVVCPWWPECGNDDWQNAYHPATAGQCGQHEGGRVRMIRCPECRKVPGAHAPSEQA